VVGRLKIDFDEVGKVQERRSRRLGKKAVEGEAIALFLKGEAAVDQGRIRLNVLEDFEDGGTAWKQRDKAFDQSPVKWSVFSARKRSS